MFQVRDHIQTLDCKINNKTNYFGINDFKACILLKQFNRSLNLLAFRLGASAEQEPRSAAEGRPSGTQMAVFHRKKRETIERDFILFISMDCPIFIFWLLTAENALPLPPTLWEYKLPPHGR